MAYCTECGKENRPEATFCRFCGYLLEKLEEIQAVESSDQNKDPTPQVKATPGEIIAKVDPISLNAPTDLQAENPIPLDVIEPVAAVSTSLSESKPAQTPALSIPEESGALSSTAQSEKGDHYSQAGSVQGVVFEGGTILQGRFRILRPISPDDETIAYEAEDLFRCWSCHAVQSDKMSQFCEVCGAELSSKPIIHLYATLADTTEQVESDTFIEEGYLYRIIVPPVITTDKKNQQLRYTIGYQSDTGKEREMDEDSLLVLQLSGVSELRGQPILGFFAIADGIGGHDAGEVASRVAVHALAANIMELVFVPEAGENSVPVEELAECVKDAVSKANQAILRVRGVSEMKIDMGSTLTAALLRGTTAIIANVGDSRTYLMHNGKLSQVTKDHSLVSKMVEQGIIQPKEIYTHEKKGAIYRSLGDKPELEIDTFSIDVVAGDRLLLCCDGLWEMVRDPTVEDVLLECFEPQQACDRLVQLANLAGGEDNITVIVINIQSL